MARRTSGYGWSGFRPSTTISERHALARHWMQRASRKGEVWDPVQIEGRAIASTPWGRAWCAHVESFRDYDNRLPRGRTYVRNGSVLHLEIRAGEIHAKVIGSRLYEQVIRIEPCKQAVWKRVRQRCAGGIGSLIELLEGRISSAVMAGMTAEVDGLLPDLKHVRMSCSCPDWALLCKHLAAVLYGVGARLDTLPRLLFTLRGVDPAELVSGAALPGQGIEVPPGAPLVEGELSSVFGIELDEEPPRSAPPASARGKAKRRLAAGPAANVARKALARRAGGRASQAAAEPPKKLQRKVGRQELLLAGVPAGTISTWLRRGLLQASAVRGVYLHTPTSRALLAAKLGRAGPKAS